MNRIILNLKPKCILFRRCHHDCGVNWMKLEIEAQKKREETLMKEVVNDLSVSYKNEGWSGSHLEKMILERVPDDDIFLL